MSALYHYTCHHNVDNIEREGMVRPNTAMTGLVWFTDLDHPFRDELGLTSHSLPCDRAEFRFLVDDPGADIVPWTVIRRRVPNLAHVLETAPGAMPRHWFVSLYPVRVVPAFLQLDGRVRA